jgi:hypothetical protein
LALAVPLRGQRYESGVAQLFSLGIMEHQTQKVAMAWWHSLMDAAGALLIVCGIPATVILGFIYLDRSDRFVFISSMVSAELIIGVVLCFIAERITKRRHRVEK